MLKENYNIEDVMRVSPIVPVIALEKADEGVDLANALIEGGINVLEITLRTKEAMRAINIISKEVKNAVVGAGTVLNEDDLKAVVRAGAKFAISPGATPKLLKTAKEMNFPLLPGVATATEIMNAMSFGYKHFKLFPSSVAGGVDALKSFEGPFKDIKFCPTGGINEDNFRSFLKLNNVLCVGGSWVAPKELIKSKDYKAITEIVKRSLNHFPL